MPAQTDQITSVLQRTFNGLEQKKEGLIRGGNSASAKSSYNVLDKKLQATAAKSNSNRIQFDEPTQYSSGSGLIRHQQQLNNGAGKSSAPKVIVLNPQYLPKTSSSENQADRNKSTNNGTSQNEASKVSLPKPKVVFYQMSQVDVGYSKIRVAGAGMANVGNTCYLNSTLQALFHTPALFNYLMFKCGSQHMSKCSSSSITSGFLQSCTVCALVQTLRDTLRLNVIRPNRIYEKLKLICKHMVQGRQEDAHEFLRYLIDSLQRCYLNSVHANKNLDAASKETTPFNQIFGGYMRQDVTCMKCKYVSTTFQHFMDILVDIRQASSIDEALQHFFRQERLGHAGDEASMYKCEKCKVKVPAKRRCYIEKPPAVLCVQLKRFSLMGGKIGKPVQLSKHLNMAPYIYRPFGSQQEDNNGKQLVQYKLVSMITHVGPTPNCGHYTAIGEAANGQFFQFDDASVRPIPLSQVLNTASYVVFYEMTRSSWAQTCAGGSSSSVDQVTTNQPSALSSSATSTTTSNNGGERFIGPQRPPIGPQRPAAASGTFTRITAEATSIIRPKIIGTNGMVNKLGVVSSAAKSVANAVADVAKTVVHNSNLSKATTGNATESSFTSDKKKSKCLVPYDDDEEDDEVDSSDDDNNVERQKETISLKIKPSFVPRALTVKKLVSVSGVNTEKKQFSSDLTKIQPSSSGKGNNQQHHPSSTAASAPAVASSSQTIQATTKNWTVTDNDQHNPSVHSDNSTGSTTGGWIITNQTSTNSRPASAMSDDSKSKWTVTPLQRAIEEDSTTSKPSTPTSSTTSTASSSSSSSSSSSEKKRKFSMCDSEERSARKRPSIDENADETDNYDADLDRGRTKKVKRIDAISSSTGNRGQQQHYRNGTADNGGNPFQVQQDRSNQYRNNGHGGSSSTGNRSASSSTTSSSPSYRQYRGNHWSSSSDNNQKRQQHGQHRDHDNYHGGSSRHQNNHHRDFYGGRRQSFNGNENKSSHNHHNNKVFNRSFSYSSSSNHSQHDNRDSFKQYNNRRRY